MIVFTIILCDLYYLYNHLLGEDTVEKLVVKGGNKLKGEVTISGAKNAAVALIPACLLINGTCRLENLPNIKNRLHKRKHSRH